MKARRPLRVSRVLHQISVGPVAYPQAKVVVVTAGWTNLVHGERIISLSEGDIAFLPARALVGGEPLPTAETVTFYIDTEFLNQQLAWANLSEPVSTAFHASAEGLGPVLAIHPSLSEGKGYVNQARMLALSDASNPRLGWELLGDSLRFLGSLDRAAPLTEERLPRDAIRAAVTAFRNGLARQWTISDLSRLSNLSTSQLTRLFNSAFGVSPMRLLTRLRVERFTELLQMTHWSIQRCSEAVGWADAGHAVRALKRACGVTPTEYRKMTRAMKCPEARALPPKPTFGDGSGEE